MWDICTGIKQSNLVTEENQPTVILIVPKNVDQNKNVRECKYQNVMSAAVSCNECRFSCLHSD